MTDFEKFEQILKEWFAEDEKSDIAKSWRAHTFEGELRRNVSRKRKQNIK
jgi:hypothetical protein